LNVVQERHFSGPDGLPRDGAYWLSAIFEKLIAEIGSTAVFWENRPSGAALFAQWSDIR
jgi:hypothetical protein